MRKRGIEPGTGMPGGSLVPGMARNGGPGTGDRQFVTALHRGLEILRAFRPSDRSGLGNAEISERTGLPNSTVSRLSYTLMTAGYLSYDPMTGRYRMGLPVLSLGYACLANLPAREMAQAPMQALADACGNGVLVALGGRDGLSMTYLATARSDGIVSLQLNTGSRLPIHTSAMGRAYLARCPEAERAEILSRIDADIPAGERRRILDGLAEARDQIDARGFYVSTGTWERDVHAVSVPYAPSRGEPGLLAFNLAGYGHVLPRERLETELGPRLAALAADLARMPA